MPYQLQTMQNTTIPSSQATRLALINVENELQSILGKSEAQNKKTATKTRQNTIQKQFKNSPDMYLKDEPNEQFKSEVQQLKQLKKNNTPSNIENAETTHRSKNAHTSSKSGGQTEMNTQTTKVMTFIEQTM